MSLENGVNAPQALMNLYGAQKASAELIRRLKEDSAAGTLLVEHANQYLRQFATLQTNLAACPPSDFPEIDAFACGFWGVSSFDYAGDHATVGKQISEAQASLDSFLSANGIKLRTLSAVETATLRTSLDSAGK